MDVSSLQEKKMSQLGRNSHKITLSTLKAQPLIASLARTEPPYT